MNPQTEAIVSARSWPSYRAIWRWHFYAGLIAIPFILWLSATGAIYLFRPQIEAWLDRPYGHLPIAGPRASAEAQVHAAIATVPGSNLHFYQLPSTPQSAVQIIVGRGANECRVYVHPQTARVLRVVNETLRPMTVIFHLHGELLMGDRGSMIVELAASWAIIMITTGLYLWWPRGTRRLGGILYPRLWQGGRVFWRDLHAVTGVWVSSLALFLLLTGLPWASNWGKYLAAARALTHTSGNPDWTSGAAAEEAARLGRNPTNMPGMTGNAEGSFYSGIDTIVAAVPPLHVAWPVMIAPPLAPGGLWTVRSDAQNRTLRSSLQLESSGAIVRREDFSQQQWIDRWVETGVAASFQSLIELTPGVVVTAVNGADQGQFSVNGQRADANYWTVDGASANVGISSNGFIGTGVSGTLGATSVLGGTNSLVSVDALQEFRFRLPVTLPNSAASQEGRSRS